MLRTHAAVSPVSPFSQSLPVPGPAIGARRRRQTSAEHDALECDLYASACPFTLAQPFKFSSNPLASFFPAASPLLPSPFRLAAGGTSCIEAGKWTWRQVTGVSLTLPIATPALHLLAAACSQEDDVPAGRCPTTLDHLWVTTPFLFLYLSSSTVCSLARCAADPDRSMRNIRPPPS